MQFCNQCGSPIEGNPAQCPACGTARMGVVATEAIDDTAGFAVPSFDPAPAAPGPLSDTGPMAPDSRFAQPATNGAPQSYDPYTGQPVYGNPPGDTLDDTNMDVAIPPPAPAPVAAAPPPPAAPAPQPAAGTGHQPAEGELNTRPEISEILIRIMGDRYNYLQEIGAGGMSIVYEMEDTILQTHVAVKVLYPELAINPEVANRFKNEAVITAKLTGNPYIIKVYDYGYKERLHYIITQFLSGKSLRDEMKERFARNEKFDWREAAEVMIKVGKALESVHEKNVVHRDIKPGNIIFENGSPILIDFGIAKIPQQEQGREWLVTTQAGMSLGTPHYISPEEAQGLGSNPKSDIYSLGVVFYEMVTGRVPFDGESAQQIMIDHVTKEPDDPALYNSNLPNHIAQIILKLLRKDPIQRLGATDLVQNLEAQLGINSRGSSVSAESVSTGGGSAGSGGRGGVQVEGATVIGKNVLKGKKAPSGGGSASKFEPIHAILIVAFLGVGYYAYTEFAPAPAVNGPVDEPTTTHIDPLEAAMSKMYDEAVIDLGERQYKTAHAKFRKVYAWNARWRNTEPAYQATKDFNEGRTAYLSGRARSSFEKAGEYFQKADQRWRQVFGQPFPFAEEYRLAAQHMSTAIGAEEDAKSASGATKMKMLWDAQKSYEAVTEKIPWEAGAYLARLDNLIGYWNVAQTAKDQKAMSSAVAQIQGTIDEALVGLEDDKENLLRVYEVWAVPIYREVVGDAKKADQMAADAAQIRREWEAEGKPAATSKDEEEAAKVGEASISESAAAAAAAPIDGETPPASN